eukprot:5956041-Amphidinium_carterae.1
MLPYRSSPPRLALGEFCSCPNSAGARMMGPRARLHGDEGSPVPPTTSCGSHILRTSKSSKFCTKQDSASAAPSSGSGSLCCH